tara:strand:+ start:66 stop:257 length:192 start_codon:yes stop_codon:yes gene_type:complete
VVEVEPASLEIVAMVVLLGMVLQAIKHREIKETAVAAAVVEAVAAVALVDLLILHHIMLVLDI